MASSRDKKIATKNIQTLKELHLISLGINLLVLIALFVFKRPTSKLSYIILSIPAFFGQYTLEKSGRPKYGRDSTGNEKLLSSGDDIKHEGLYEYMFDVVYITWIIDILMVIFGTNYVWWLYSVIPGFASYKVFGFVKPYLFKGSGSAPKSEAGVQTNGESKKDTLSKRQAKLQARGEKQKVRYR
ncbi:SRP-independent targeting protein 2 [[Candida] anglica]|uniref:SRP-independent targeting protein 2 n=1 Tax=[Candida] anglica TaxID=148631 RepID=A0ABP0EA66_9ASCO